MRLVDDDSEVPPGYVLRLAVGGLFRGCLHDLGELLQGRDDDASPVAFQGFLELAGVLVDAHDCAGSVV